MSIRKYEALSRCRNEIETLVLGSSHALYGYWAEKGEFNLAEPSQDLFCSYKVLEHWINKGMSRLKRVILFVDVFAPGNVLAKSSECFRLVTYRHLYGLDVKPLRSDTALGFSYDEVEKLFSRQVVQYHPLEDRAYRGNFSKKDGKPFKAPDSTLQARVASHLKLNKGDELRRIDKMIDLLNARGIDLVLVEPPLREDFRRELPEDRERLREALYRDVSQLTKVRRIDLIDCEAFKRGDFNDMDHLNEKGARKLAKIVRSMLGICPPKRKFNMKIIKVKRVGIEKRLIAFGHTLFNS